MPVVPPPAVPSRFNRGGLASAQPAATPALAGVTWTYSDVGSATYSGRVDRCDGSTWVMIVPPSGTYVPTSGTAGLKVASDGTGTHSQFIVANPDINDIDSTNGAQANAILAGGESGFPNRIGPGAQLCFILGAYDCDINSGYGSGGAVHALMDILLSAHGRFTGAGQVSHSSALGGSRALAQADSGQSVSFAMLRGTGSGTWVQTLTITATGGTFTLRAGRYVTAAIAWNASASAIQTAINAVLAAAPGTTVAVTGTGPFTVTQTGGGEGFFWADTSLLTGGTASLAVTKVGGPTAYKAGASLTAPAAEGYDCWVSADYARAVNRQNQAAAKYSNAFGYRVVAKHLGGLAHGVDAVANDGDRSVEHFAVSRQTTDGAAHRLCEDDAGGTLIVLEDNTAYSVFVECVAARTDSHSPVQVARFRVEGIVYRQSGVATVVWLPDTTSTFDPQGTGVTLVASADTTNGALSLTATAIAAQTWNWEAYTRLTKVAF